MMKCYNILSGVMLLLLPISTSFSLPSAPRPLGTHRPKDNLNGLSASEHRDGLDDKTPVLQTEEDDELFKDVDPKILASVLLKALNQSQVQNTLKEEDLKNREETTQDSPGDVHSKMTFSNVSSLWRSDRDRDGREELELLMAVKGKEQEKAEEEEKARAQQEEDKMTEKVTSRTTGQTVQIHRGQPTTSSNGREGNGQESVSWQESTRQGHGSDDEEEEQLNPEELKSLERMMKEFPRVNSAIKRDGGSEPKHRESRGYTSYNEVLPAHKGSDPAMSRKKLKWQEETQKAVYFPTFKAGNFMDDFEVNDDGNDATQSQLPAEQKEMEEEEEEELSLEEEEARAKAEQEEMRRQAAEVQKAKMEEEKLADIASDMLLRYMVKQNNGNQKSSSPTFNAMEDKRSEEITEEDDIDPQTIDKLIEISTKLHLPADDVVDIISDVEKKKRKDISRWQQPQSLLSSSPTSASQLLANDYNPPVAKQPFQTVNLLKSWFQEKTPGQAKDVWSKQERPLPASEHAWAKAQSPLYIKTPKSIWSGYPNYLFRFPTHYQRRFYPYYSVVYPPPLQPSYYRTRPPLVNGPFLLDHIDRGYTFPPRRPYQSWIQPGLRKPPTYSLPLYPLPRPPRPVFLSKPKHSFAFASVPPMTETREKNYYNDLERFVQKILMRRPQGKD